MSKENVLFVIAGLLLGLILGFMLANSVAKNMLVPAAAVSQTSNSSLPAGHPEVGNSPNAQSSATMPEIQAAIDKAKQEPNNYDAQMKAAELYYQIDRYDDAIEFLKRANQLKPDNYEVIVNLGNANFDTNHFDEAEKWYSAALAKHPEDVNVRTDLGLTFMFREPANYDRAIQEFQRSLQDDPKHLQTLQNLTVAYAKKGDAANAKTTLARLESVDANNKAIPSLREEIQKLEVK